jgi:pilus assembly protein CpaE
VALTAGAAAPHPWRESAAAPLLTESTTMDDIARIPESAAVPDAGPSLLVFGPRPDSLAKIAQALRAGRVGAVVSTFTGRGEQLAGTVARRRPAILVLDMPDADAQTLEQVDAIEHLYPNMKSVLVCRRHEPEFIKQAMRVGVREVLPADTELDALREVVGRVVNKRGAEPTHEGRVLAFISCSGGGSGATFLATNVAYELASAHDKKVVVIDLNLQWGDAALLISHKKPVSTLADLATQVQRVDAAFLASSLLAVHANLGILAAPEDPVQALDIKPEHIDMLLRLARSEYDVVVLDVGGTLDAVTVRAMDHADAIFPVMQVSVPFIRDAKRLLKALASLEYPADKIRLLVNRYQKGGEIRLADVEQAVGTTVAQTFPNDYAVVTDAVNQGAPVMELARHSAIARSIQQFAQTLVPEHSLPARGWMARLLRRA